MNQLPIREKPWVGRNHTLTSYLNPYIKSTWNGTKCWKHKIHDERIL